MLMMTISNRGYKQTDQPTDRPTDLVTNRAAIATKKVLCFKMFCNLGFFLLCRPNLRTFFGWIGGWNKV